jgi:hypothetical protein
MKKILLLIVLLIPYTASYANLTHIEGSLFRDGNISINYPCSFGGKPLVIYSSTINNTQKISSKTAIYPIYIDPDYSASPLTVSACTNQ